MSHVLLVHGGGHGAWCWDQVRSHLDADGIASTAFDLPGAGDDPTPRAGISLSDYIDATVARVDSIDDDVILVGHSIAGMTLPGVLAARGARIRQTLFIAALISELGERGIDSIPGDRRPSYYRMAENSIDGSFQPSFPAAWNRFFPSLDEDTARAAYAKLTPQPLGPYLQPNPSAIPTSSTRCRYVLLADDRTFPENRARVFASRARAELIVRPGDHCWMLTDPRACAAAIAEVARS